MKLNIAICDDNTEDLQKLYRYLNLSSFASDADMHIDIYTNAEDLIKYCTTNDATYHVLMLDIEMPGIDGIKAAKSIRQTLNKTKIVFVSSYPQYMHDSFSVHPYHFLQKPVSQNDINNLICDIINDFNNSISLVTIIDSTECEYTIDLKDVYYIDCIDSRTKMLSFHMSDTEIVTKGTISHWDSLLKENSFFICSRTTLVNLFHIHYLTENQIVLTNGKTISISRRKLKEIRELFLNKVVAVHKY